MVIGFDVSTSSFDHAIQICEVAYGYEGPAWEQVKSTENMEALVDFLENDGVEVSIY